jgi:hypothetical protein
MNEITITPLYTSVQLLGDDPELAAIGAIVSLLENTDFHGVSGFNPLVSTQKDRIVRYLFNRYALEEYSPHS